MVCFGLWKASYRIRKLPTNGMDNGPWSLEAAIPTFIYIKYHCLKFVPMWMDVLPRSIPDWTTHRPDSATWKRLLNMRTWSKKRYQNKNQMAFRNKKGIICVVLEVSIDLDPKICTVNAREQVFVLGNSQTDTEWNRRRRRASTHWCPYCSRSDNTQH